MPRSSSESAVLCLLCHKKFSAATLAHHMRDVHKDQIFACGRCPQNFHDLSGLQNHMRQDHGVGDRPQRMKKIPAKLKEYISKKPAIPSVGSDKTAKSADLKIADETSDAPASISCDFDESSVKIVAKEERTPKCPLCGMLAENFEALTAHVIVHFDTQRQVTYACETCAGEFTSKDDLLEHKLSHIQPAPSRVKDDSADIESRESFAAVTENRRRESFGQSNSNLNENKTDKDDDDADTIVEDCGDTGAAAERPKRKNESTEAVNEIPPVMRQVKRSRIKKALETAKTRTVPREVVCTLCQEVFSSMAELNEHRISDHKQSPVLKYGGRTMSVETSSVSPITTTNHCSLCQSIFNSEKALLTHQAESHPYLNKPDSALSRDDKDDLEQTCHDEDISDLPDLESNSNNTSIDCTRVVFTSGKPFENTSLPLTLDKDNAELAVSNSESSENTDLWMIGVKLDKYELFRCFLCPKIFGSSAHLVIHNESSHYGPGVTSDSVSMDDASRAHDASPVVLGESMGPETSGFPVKNETTVVIIQRRNENDQTYVDSSVSVSDKEGSSALTSDAVEEVIGRDKRHVKCETNRALVFRPQRGVNRRMGYFCSVCNSEFHSEHQLDDHELTHPEIMFCCDNCGLLFKSTSSLNEHSQEVHTQSNVENLRCLKSGKPPCDEKRHVRWHCELCDKKFLTETKLECHSRLHAGEKKFECSQCGMAFINRASLNMHTLRHNDEESTTSVKNEFPCSQCGKFFRDANAVQVHSYIHRKDRYECEICGKKFIFKARLKEHTRIHTGEKKFECSECDMSFIHGSTFRNHMRRHNGEEPCYKKSNPNDSPALCQECGKEFRNNQALKNHSKIHDDLQLQCDLCPKKFKSVTYLRNHAKLHLSAPARECTICERTFRTASSLHEHMVSHTGEKPYTCDICGFATGTIYRLNKHTKSRHTSFKYDCPECSLQLTTFQGLLRHYMHHTREHAYKCSYCHKLFIIEANAKRHMQFHAKKGIAAQCLSNLLHTYTCKECGKSLRSFANLVIHLYLKHGYTYDRFPELPVNLKFQNPLPNFMQEEMDVEEDNELYSRTSAEPQAVKILVTGDGLLEGKEEPIRLEDFTILTADSLDAATTLTIPANVDRDALSIAVSQLIGMQQGEAGEVTITIPEYATPPTDR